MILKNKCIVHGAGALEMGTKRNYITSAPTLLERMANRKAAAEAAQAAQGGSRKERKRRNAEMGQC